MNRGLPQNYRGLARSFGVLGANMRLSPFSHCTRIGSKSRPRQRSGITIVEVAVGALLVGVLLVSSLSLLGAAVRTHYSMNELLDGPMLAEQLLAEITAMPYEDPEDGSGARGLDNSETTINRLTWDDVDDYDSYVETPPSTRDGTAMTVYTGWTREAYVVWVDQSTGAEDLADSGAKRIEVQVTSPNGRVTTRHAFRTRWGVLEQPPAVDSTVVVELQSSLEIGMGGQRAQWSSNLLNHAADPNAN